MRKLLQGALFLVELTGALIAIAISGLMLGVICAFELITRRKNEPVAVPDAVDIEERSEALAAVLRSFVNPTRSKI